MMKKLTLLFSICLLLTVQNRADEGNEVLEPDFSIQRFSPVLANKVMIRFKQEFAGSLKMGVNMTSYAAPNAVLNIEGATIDRPMLPPKASLTFNKELKKNDKALSTSRINEIIQAEEPLLRTFVVSYSGEVNPEKFCRKLMDQNPAIEIAEPYYIPRSLHSTNDPEFSSQDVLKTIKAVDAWDDETMRGDSSVIIGIIDNGINQGHVDLRPNIAPNYGEIEGNGIDDDGNGYVDDYIGYNYAYLLDHTSPGNTYYDDPHGTEVAGIIGAQADNGKGICGTGYNCRILPIKVAYDGQYRFGYDGIIYAARRGCKVINLSWGEVYTYSALHQSIINYAIANDVAIVAAGGNLDDWKYLSKYHDFHVFYPANYQGVLGVGEVEADDRAHYGSARGVQIDVMAQAEGNMTVKGTASYGPVGNGTSYAAPIVSGFVGCIRAKYPYLSAIQALEYARQCTDDITGVNSTWKNKIHGRINYTKAQKIDPFSIPSIVPVEKSLKTYFNDKNDLYDTVDINIKAHNYLGAYQDIMFVLSKVNENDNTFKIISDSVHYGKVEAEEDLVIGPFKVQSLSNNFDRSFLRVDIYGYNVHGQENYHDFFLLYYIPQPLMRNFSNDVFAFSVSDRGKLGYDGGNFYVRNGSGIEFGNQRLLYQGGLAVADQDGNRQVFANSSANGIEDFSEFNIVTPFDGPEGDFCIVADDNLSESNKIGIQVKQKFEIASTNNAFFKAKVTTKNTSGNLKSNLAVGYYFDWDIGLRFEENTTRLFTEGLPDGLTSINAAAEISYQETGAPYVGIMVYSDEEQAEPQMAGTVNAQKIIEGLNSGTSIHDAQGTIGDISIIAGMKFNGEWQPDAEKTFNMCVCAGNTEEEVKKHLRNCYQGNPVKETVLDNSGIRVYPQPAIDKATIKINPEHVGQISYGVIDLFGNYVTKNREVFLGSEGDSFAIDLNNLASGTYLVKVRTAKGIMVKPLRVVK